MLMLKFITYHGPPVSSLPTAWNGPYFEQLWIRELHSAPDSRQSVTQLNTRWTWSLLRIIFSGGSKLGLARGPHVGQE